MTPLADAVNEALANRPELARCKSPARSIESDTRLYREQTKPQVDLIGSYTRNGLAGPRLRCKADPIRSPPASVL